MGAAAGAASAVRYLGGCQVLSGVGRTSPPHPPGRLVPLVPGFSANHLHLRIPAKRGTAAHRFNTCRFHDDRPLVHRSGDRVPEIPVKNSVRDLRTQLEWTQADLADLLGVSRQTVNAIETEKYDPSLPLALKIAKTFSKPVEEIFKA